jgi:hypothetical protein
MTKRFADDQSQAILARALEIDAQSADGLSSAQLEAVASELGISPLALAKAMNEHGVSMVSRGRFTSGPPAPSRAPWGRTFALLAIVAVVALVASLLVLRSRPGGIEVSRAPQAVPIQPAGEAVVPAAATPSPSPLARPKAATKAARKKAPED